MDAPPSSSWFIEKAVELATFIAGALALLWRVVTMAAKLQAEVNQLKEETMAQAELLSKITERQDLRHEQNLNAIYSRPDKGDFQRFQDQVATQLKDLKEFISRH
jgi:hypothetical protein